VVELVLTTGERLRIGREVNAEHLQRVLAALQTVRSGGFDDAGGDDSGGDSC
jgi:hypothetical protein